MIASSNDTAPKCGAAGTLAGEGCGSQSSALPCIFDVRAIRTAHVTVNRYGPAGNIKTGLYGFDAIFIPVKEAT
jgi:hypothetical protein